MNNTFVECQNCSKNIEVDSYGSAHAVRIQRAHFQVEFDSEGCFDINEKETNVKCECWLCNDCYLKNPDLCRFFARIDMRVR